MDDEVGNLKRVDARSRGGASAARPSDTPEGRRLEHPDAFRSDWEGGPTKSMGGEPVEALTPGRARNTLKRTTTPGEHRAVHGLAPCDVQRTPCRVLRPEGGRSGASPAARVQSSGRQTTRVERPSLLAASAVARSANVMRVAGVERRHGSAGGKSSEGAQPHERRRHETRPEG
jgi:hypothetical protein